jgi:putative Mg2+ transporter-C (MgtC) family protein
METEMLLRLLLAALWGGIVGAEREYRSKSAGFRTMMMISIGACLFTILSIAIGGPANGDRIAANIVTGIGFLGAGVIFKGTNRVNGITTAATIWAVSAVGMGMGAGYYFVSGSACLLILLVLAILPYAEKTIDRLNLSREYSIDCPYSEQAQHSFEELLQKAHLEFRIINHIKQGDNLSMTWEVGGHRKNHDQFVGTVLKDETVKRFEY